MAWDVHASDLQTFANDQELEEQKIDVPELVANKAERQQEPFAFAFDQVYLEQNGHVHDHDHACVHGYVHGKYKQEKS